MKFKIIPKTDIIPPVDHNVIVVKHIDCALYGRHYIEDEITPGLIAKILNDVPKGIEASLCLDPDGEGYYGCLEVVSDGEWLSLCYDYEETKTYFSYNPRFASTVKLLEETDPGDENIYTPIDYDGQSPVPKCQAITDMDAGVKAVEYFIHTGKCYPGIDWAYYP
ncbi:MAG: hypothetical protein K1W24_05915 [Lachnospiraceae bacterium]